MTMGQKMRLLLVLALGCWAILLIALSGAIVAIHS